MTTMATTTLVNNKVAYHLYTIHEKMEAGIALVGTEVKSLRMGAANLRESYILVTDEFEGWIKNMNIAHYSHGNIQNHETTRPRKLLLKKRELKTLFYAVKKKGMTIVPLRVFLKGHLIKITIGLGKGKKTFEKKSALKEKDIKRETDRYLKSQKFK